MGFPNQGLVSQQDKRQPSFPCLRDCPSKPQHIVKCSRVSRGRSPASAATGWAESLHIGQEGVLHGGFMPKAKGNPPCRIGREGIGNDNKTLHREQCFGHQYVAQFSVSLTNKKESLNRSKCQGLSQGQAVDNHWLNYSVLGLSFRVGLGFGGFFPPFCF